MVFIKTHFKALLGSILIGSMAALSMPAMATNEAMMDLLKILRDKGSITAEEYELLANASAADKEKAEGAAAEVKAEVKEATKSLPKITTKGKLQFEDKKNGNKFRIGGRLMADTTWGLGDVDFEGEGGTPVTEFRRARLYVSGVFQEFWKYKFQYDFAADQSGANPNTAGIRDAYLAYTGFKPVSVTVGHHKTPLSMEELTSSKYITFIERSQMVNGIVTDAGGGRQYALTAKGYFNDMFTASASVYAGTANEDTAEDQSGFVGRLTFSPIHEKTQAVHLGVGFNRHKAVNGGIDMDAEPEVHPGADIVETDADDHETATVFVAEAAGVWGPLSLQAEYATADVEDSPTERDVTADAWYVYGSYYLTGENRRYDWKGGAFKQTKVKNPLHKGGMGAWEVALRYTSGEFENADAADSDEADILTMGINWYPSNNIRFSANYVNVLDASDGALREIGGELETGAEADDAEYLIARAQWYF
ncbi:MAG: porin [Pseudomonadota bacterium]